MGRLYPPGVGSTGKTFSGRGGTSAAALPLPEPGPAKPYPLPGYPQTLPKPANDNYPRPANDNHRPGTGSGAGKPPTTIRRGLMPRSWPRLPRFGLVFSAVGVVPGWEAVPYPTPIIGPGGMYSRCPNPAGFGGPFSTGFPYFPGSAVIQLDACINGQAVPPESFPGPGLGPGGAKDWGYWRWSNIDQTHYTHLWSIRNGRLGNIANSPLPSYRVASSSPPHVPPPSKPEGREKKFKFQGPVRVGVDFLSEVGDVVQCGFSALPARRKAQAYRKAGGKLGRLAKAQLVYDFWGELDFVAFGGCMFANEVEDRAYGRLGRFTARANRRRGNLFGLAAGPAL